MMQCSNCKFYDGQRCRRYAPRNYYSGCITHFPEMATNDWCGEFVSKDGVYEKQEGIRYSTVQLLARDGPMPKKAVINKIKREMRNWDEDFIDSALMRWIHEGLILEEKGVLSLDYKNE